MKNINFFSFLSQVTSGISLFLILSGAVAGFVIYIKYSLLSAIAAAFIGTVPGIVFLIFSEGFFILLELLKESKKQTKILNDLKESILNEQKV